MKLYHYTCIQHWPTILASGLLKVTESNISPVVDHAGPDVVWLTTDSRCKHGHGLELSAVDKTRIRITVDVPVDDVHVWRQWASAHGADPRFMAALASSGGSSTWRVIERPIPSSEWVEVVDCATGYPLWDAADAQRAVLANLFAPL